MSQNNNDNRNIIVEAITKSIAHIAQTYDNLCICCNNCQQITEVQAPVSEDSGTEACHLCDRVHEPHQACPYLFSLQSEETATAEEGVSSEMTSQTVTFLDANQGDVVVRDNTQNKVALVDNTDDLALGTFLARPTLIKSKTWTTSEVIGVVDTFKPWYEFLNNAVIKRKLENYAFLRGNLHVKTIVNGTPFQYGSIRMCYKPLLGWIADPIRASVFSAATSMIPYSQVPGYYIFPEANAGGEMVLPFFLHKNWMNITDAAEVQNMGEMVHAIYAPLRVAVTGGTTSVTLRTYAWMTDVQLMGSTNKLTLQGDEYGQGPISRPATAIAAIASKLTEIPIIGTFARATSIGASAVSSIASLFGYTNVPVIADVHGYQPMNGPMLASAHIGTPVQKLAYDPKQELSIDPAPHGIGDQDELSIAYIKEKESLFGTTDWTTAQADGTQILNVRINPMLFGKVDLNNTVPALVGTRAYHTPLSYLSGLFTHWRGDIKIRLKVVCTKFHKGRLKISYDPIGDITSSDPGENAVYTEIFDIGEHTDLTINVPYHQDTGWLEIRKQLSDNWTTGSANAPRRGYDNGVLTVRVLNGLTAPAASTVTILAYVVGGDNFEFANPASWVGNTVTFNYPSFFALQAQDTTSVETYEVSMGNPATTTEDRYALNFGECIGSLRNVIHRYSNFETTALPQLGSNLYSVIFKVLKRMPYTPGYDPNWVSTSANKVLAASGTAPYIFNTMHPLPYITGMFLGYRGSVNYCITPSTDGRNVISDLRVSRDTSNSYTNSASRYISLSSTSAYAASLSNKARLLGTSRYDVDGTGGMAITATNTNGSLVFNLPDYNNYNFSLVDPTKYLLGNTSDGTTTQNAIVQYLAKRIDDTQPDIGLVSTLQTQLAAGPDFTCLFWYCCPTLDYFGGVPTAT